MLFIAYLFRKIGSFMKKIIYLSMFIMFLSCDVVEKISTKNEHIKFKTSQGDLVNKLSKIINSDEISFGRSVKKTKGNIKIDIIVTVLKKDISSINDSLLLSHSNVIKKEISRSLLSIKDYTDLNIIFKEEEKDNGIIKNCSKKIVKKLK